MTARREGFWNKVLVRLYSLCFKLKAISIGFATLLLWASLNPCCLNYMFFCFFSLSSKIVEFNCTCVLNKNALELMKKVVMC